MYFFLFVLLHNRSVLLGNPEVLCEEMVFDFVRKKLEREEVEK